jgi:hypothetical protein
MKGIPREEEMRRRKTSVLMCRCPNTVSDELNKKMSGRPLCSGYGAHRHFCLSSGYPLESVREADILCPAFAYGVDEPEIDAWREG